MSFITQGGSYEWKLIQGTATYDKTNFSEGKLNDALFEELSIGNVVARELSLRLYNATLSTGTAFDLVLEETDADGLTIEVPKGTYFIDTQETSPYSEFTNVTAFDAMLKTEATYLASGEWTAKTDAAIVSEIASDIGVEVEPVTLAYLTENPITFTEAPSMGKDGTTDREMLSYIAVLRGGNWIINDDNQLELVLLTGRLNSVDIVFIGTDGKFYSDKLINMPSSAAFVTFDSQGRSYSTPKAEITDESVVLYLDHSGACQTAAYYEIKSVAPLEEVIEIGDEVVEFDVSPAETVTRIELVVNSTLSYRSPSGLTEEEWQALGGKCITASLPIMASQEAADNLYSMLHGLTYIPHEAQSVYVDPDVPLGTRLHIKNDTVVLSNRTLNIDLLCASDLAADPTEALQSSYPYIDPVVRQTRREIAQNRASIQVNADNIKSEVTRINTELGENLAPLTSMRTDDLTYWKVYVNPAMVTNLADGWMHVEGVGAESRALFIPLARAISYDSLTLMVEIRNATYTSGTVLVQYTGYAGTKPQYMPKGSLTNPANGAHYIQLVPNPDTDNTSSLFNIMIWRLNSAEFSFDIRLSLYAGNYTGDFIPYSAYSQSSRVTQTADGIIVELLTKITEAEAQALVDAYGEEVRKYISWANGVLELGESSSQFKALLDNTHLAFTGADGQECAWISNNQLFINSAVLNGPLIIRYQPSSTVGWQQYADSNNIYHLKPVTGLEAN